MTFKFRVKKILFSILLIFTISFSQNSPVIVHSLEESPIQVEETLNRHYDLWSTPFDVTGGGTLMSLRPEITVDPSDNVHIIWSDPEDLAGSSGSDWDVFHRYWNATSTSWSSIALVSVGSVGASEAPTIVADDFGNVHAMWFDWPDPSVLLHSIWDASTQTWSIPTIVEPLSTQNSLWPDLATRNGDLFVVWQDLTNMLGAGGDHDLFYKRRYNNGTWSPTELITTESSGVSRLPSIFVDASENVYISWDDELDYTGEGDGLDLDVFFKMRSASTGLWSSPEVVSSGLSVKHQRSTVAVDDFGNRHIVWYNYTVIDRLVEEDKDIHYRMWNSTLASWGSVEIISSESSMRSEVPDIALDSEGNLHCFWFDRVDYAGAGGDQDIFYKVKNINTQTWQSLTLITVGSHQDAWRPIAALDSQERMHLVWQEGIRSADVDIMYSYGIATGDNVELSFVDTPEDLIYELNSTDNVLSWILQDDNVSSTFYTIERNGTEVANGSWVSLEAVTLNIDNLNLGVYEFTLNATDGYGDYLTDIVMVTVVEELPSNFDWDFVVNIAFGVMIATSVVILSMTFSGGKKK